MNLRDRMAALRKLRCGELRRDEGPVRAVCDPTHVGPAALPSRVAGVEGHGVHGRLSSAATDSEHEAPLSRSAVEPL